MQGKLKSDCTYPGEHSEKTEKALFMPQADPWYRVNLQQIKQKTKNNKAKPTEGGESNFQS